MRRAPEAMRKPDAEWVEGFEVLLQYRDKIFRDHYPKAMLSAQDQTSKDTGSISLDLGIWFLLRDWHARIF